MTVLITHNVPFWIVLKIDLQIERNHDGHGSRFVQAIGFCVFAKSYVHILHSFLFMSLLSVLLTYDWYMYRQPL